MRSASQTLAYRRLVGTARQLAKAGVEKEPIWLEALTRCPPIPSEPVRKPKPRNIVFPEDRFIQSFYDRFPAAQQAPLDLASAGPPVARKFALRQLELVEEGRTPKQARSIVDREFREAGLLDLPGGQGDSAMRHVQLEEEAALQEAMSELNR